MKPLAIDLFCGLGGWTRGLLAEGWDVIGFDIERHDYGNGKRYPAQLVLQDVLTLHGSQFKDASLIVASPPCQEYSYMAMPWSWAKVIAAEYRNGTRDVKQLTALFDACFRIQREAIEAAGHFIPRVVENVRGAQPWVGRSRWHYGSYHLWGDVPALMPITQRIAKDLRRRERNGKNVILSSVVDRVNDGRKNDGGSGFNIAHNIESGTGQNPVTSRDCGIEAEGIKQGGDWFNADQPSISRMCSSKSNARKAASAAIAEIPFPLARWIARAWYPTSAPSQTPS